MTRTPLTGALALGLLLTAGCGGATSPRADSERERDRPRAAARLSPTPEPTPDPTPDPTSPATPQRERRSMAAEPEPAQPTGNALTIQQSPDAHLVGAGALGAAWSVTATGDEEGRMASTCQRATLRDIGATRTRVRDFETTDASAAQAVSHFGDARSAWRAEQVFVAWREDCAQELRRRDAALGTVRHGAWLSVVEVAGVPSPRKRMRGVLAAVEATF